MSTIWDQLGAAGLTGLPYSLATDGTLGYEPGAITEDQAAQIRSIVSAGLLDDVRSTICDQIDQAAERSRRKYITPGSGQAMAYQEKKAEADAVSAKLAADNTLVPSAQDYPMLAASLGIEGSTIAEIASLVQETALQWTAVAAQIETLRLGGKQRVATAQTADEIRAIPAGIAWP